MTIIIYPRQDLITNESYVFSGNGGIGTIQLTADNWNGGNATLQTSIPTTGFKFVNDDDPSNMSQLFQDFTLLIKQIQ